MEIAHSNTPSYTGCDSWNASQKIAVKRYLPAIRIFAELLLNSLIGSKRFGSIPSKHDNQYYADDRAGSDTLCDALADTYCQRVKSCFVSRTKNGDVIRRKEPAEKEADTAAQAGK